MIQPEIEGSDANDSNLQSSESYEHDAQSVFFEMVGFVKRSFEVILYTQPLKSGRGHKSEFMLMLVDFRAEVGGGGWWS